MRQSVFLAYEPSPATQGLDEDREHRQEEGCGGGRGGEGRRAAVSGTRGEIKGASSTIDCIKIGLHLQLS